LYFCLCAEPKVSFQGWCPSSETVAFIIKSRRPCSPWDASEKLAKSNILGPLLPSKRSQQYLLSGPAAPAKRYFKAVAARHMKSVNRRFGSLAITTSCVPEKASTPGFGSIVYPTPCATGMWICPIWLDKGPYSQLVGPFVLF
jgi:hypothetical protein